MVLGSKRKRVFGGPPRIERPRIPGFMIFRMFVIGAIAVIAAIYALWRSYSVRPMPMLVPVPSATASEIPAPDLEP